ncbi:unnamed protein product [Clonostachys chloroleuca]|uniref:AGA1 A-agglutinin anchor subunit n=1 Tax=Clonostachys chloroleuca TaxID=1926264 RepID=A0AA35M1F9_9HYPO|nr:unnamed protein product [Clonostachys chloroleuca]
MSSSIARTRSLRKPTTVPPVSASNSSSPSADSQANSDGRYGSPSRLPVKPPTRSSTSTSTSSQTRLATAIPTAGAAATTNTTTATTTTARPTTVLRQPRSVSGSRVRPVPGKQPPEPTKKETATSPTTTTAAGRYPPITSMTRATTATTRTLGTRPTSTGSQTTTRRIPPGHTRAKSTVTTGNTNGAGLSSRAPSQPTTNGSTTRSLHAPKVSIDKGSSISTPTKQQQPPQQAAPRLRPAFSTLQQHYSPAKSAAPKPLTSAILAPPSPSKLPANVAASAETSRLQTELLQLHLLHRDAAAVDADWQASAKVKLGQRFEQLVSTNREIAEQDRAAVEGLNVLVLREWGAAGGLEERIQALDGIVNGLWTLTEAGGRYARLVRRFERWIDQVSELEEARQTGQMSVQKSGGQALFVDELDSSWKEDLSSITRRLDGWRRQLRDIGDLPAGEGTQGSNLARMLEGSRALIHGTLAELSLMEDIETQILAREDVWIERMNRDEERDDTPGAGAIWRLV